MTTTADRSQPGASRSRRTAAVAATAAATAAALAFGVGAPAAGAAAAAPSDCGKSGTDLCLPSTGVTTGGVLGLLTAVLNVTGMNPVFASKASNLGWNMTYSGTPKSIYQFVDSQPYIATGSAGNYNCGAVTTDNCRQVSLFSYGFGVNALNIAEQNLYAAAQKGTLSAATGSGSTATTLISYLINNPLTPDGGLITRFPAFFKALGISTDQPPTGLVDPATPTASNISNSFLSTTWAYNPLADFPIDLNPFALANTLLANIPPISDLQQQLAYVSPSALAVPPVGVWNNLAGSLYNSSYGFTVGGPSFVQYDGNVFPPNNVGRQFVVNASGEQQPEFLRSFSTLAATNYVAESGKIFNGCPAGAGKCPQNTALPILYPTQLLGALTNPLLAAIKSPYLLGNPIGDVLAPALKILVNIGYDDVITPEMLNKPDPLNLFGATFAKEGYQAWDRQFVGQKFTAPSPTNPDAPVAFGWFNNPALTAADTKQAYADAWSAFTGAVTAQFAKPLWGILVPNPATVPAGAATPAKPVAAAAKTALVKPAASTEATDPAPAPAVNTPAPVTIPEPVTTKTLTSLAGDTPAAPAVPAHRGGGSSVSTGGGSNSDTGTGAAGHRGPHAAS